MNNRSFHSPGMVLNSIRVIGPEFSNRRTSGDHVNNFSFRNSLINVTVIQDETVNNTNETVASIRARHSIMNSESNNQSHPSPDEVVIKGRGRRSLPIKWSPIPIESPQKTPLSALINKNSPKRGLIALRSSPRKRLQLNDASSEIVQSRKSLMSSSPLARRTSTTDVASRSPVTSTPDKSVSMLSKDQLVHVLNSIVEKHPYIKEEIGSMLATKDSSSDNGIDDRRVSSKRTFDTIKSDAED